MTDTLQRFIFQDTCVRGKIVRFDGALKTILAQHHYPIEITELLSQTLCASVLLSAILKYDGQLTVQFQGEGPLKMLVAKCDHLNRVRATAQWDKESLLSELKKNFESGELVITIQKNKTNQRYQSIVKIDHHSVSDSLEGYFLKSEQLETRLWLAYDKDKQEAVGLLLQKLPEIEDSNEAWEHIQTLANTLTEQELLSWDTETLLNKLFHEETIQLFEPQPVSFFCPCSAEKMLHAITVLGEEEALKILSTNRFIEVSCDYCNEHFEFDESEIRQLFTRH